MPARSSYACGACGQRTPKWHGRCPGCAEWGTLVEEPAADADEARAATTAATPARPVALADVNATDADRLGTGIGELDRVLGGGLVPGALVLLAGEPGIGKSTITAAALANLAGAGERVLYVSGEESPAQVAMRARRLGEAALDIPLIAATDVDVVAATLAAERPAACVVDSIQTMLVPGLSGAAGTVGQVREAAGRLAAAAKRLDVALILVGHVTKDGAVAGPRVLEHLVDCVLQFDGERDRTYRTLRALKNRFGSTNEVGVFEMAERGLVEVEDASSRFVAEARRAPGSVFVCAMEGSRPLLVEVQALVSRSDVVPPRRVANGIDRNRLALILAVLARHAGIPTGSCDVFVSVAGGIRVDEPGADLGIALAIASAARGVALGDADRPLAAFGEVGLTGELRAVAHPDRRRAEAGRFGLAPVLEPGATPTLRAAIERLPAGAVADDPAAAEDLSAAA